MNKSNITYRAFKLYHSYNKKYLPVSIMYTIFSNLTPFFSLWMSAEIVNALYEHRSTQEIYMLVGITLLGNFMIRALGAFFSRWLDTELKILNYKEAEALNAKTLSLDYVKLEDPAIRQKRRKITENRCINNYGTEYLRQLITYTIQCVINIFLASLFMAEMISSILAAGITFTSVFLFLGLVLSIMLNVLAGFYQSQKNSKTSKAIGEQLLEENRIGSGFQTDDADNRIYKQQMLIDKLYVPISKKHLQLFSQAETIAFKTSIPVTLSEKLSELCSYLIVCLYCTLDAFSVGSVIKYVGYLSKMITYINMILRLGPAIKENEPFLKDYLDYFDIENEMYQGSLTVEKRSDKKFDISFKNVSFRYAGTDAYALKNISIDLKVGEKLAVVGQNGSGKTTFIKLLCRLYDPTKGEIYMNDFNIRKYDYREYLNLFSVVFQDYKLLSMSLGNNVSSEETYDAPKAERLLREIGFGERFDTMPKGLETSLYKDFDEEGINISGGEAQKIALARALYKDAPFIILDEPTAALDPISEAEIYSKFDEIVGDKTAIYISHRLSSCRFCDKIAVFDKGEIVQVGTHEELLADKNGKYYELWNAQAQYYTENTCIQ